MAVLADRHQIPEMMPATVTKRLPVMSVQHDSTITGVGTTPSPTLLAGIIIALIDRLPPSIPVRRVLPVVSSRVIKPTVDSGTPSEHD